MSAVKKSRWLMLVAAHDDDDAHVAERPAWRHGAVSGGLADAVDRGCRMFLNGPLGHVMAAEAVALAEGPSAVVPDLRPGP